MGLGGERDQHPASGPEDSSVQNSSHSSEEKRCELSSKAALHPFIRLSLQRGGGGYLSQQAAPPSPCPASPAPLLGREEARVARVPMAGG